MRTARLLVAASIPVAALGIALARGRKTEPAPEPAPPPAPAEPTPPPPPPAPALFTGGLPVAVDTLPNGLASLSAPGCNACHWAAHDTWSGSAHAGAWASETFQLGLAGAGGSTVCVSCHLPLTNQHDQLAAGYVDGDLSRPRLGGLRRHRHHPKIGHQRLFVRTGPAPGEGEQDQGAHRAHHSARRPNAGSAGIEFTGSSAE